MTLKNLIEQRKQESFTDPSQASDEEALGILVSSYFEWDGLAIMRTFGEALTDANFHSEAEKVAAIQAAVAEDRA